jgi:hypothetical protein
MKNTIFRFATASALAILACLFAFEATPLRAQFFTVSLSPEEALRGVRSEVGWLRSATRTAPNYVRDGYSNLWDRFQSLRSAFDRFKATLSPDQQARAANELAELSSGLDIIQEAFGDSSRGAAESQANPTAFRRMCGVLDRGVVFWSNEFERVNRLLNIP